jgi:hypothetical protein
MALKKSETKLQHQKSHRRSNYAAKHIGSVKRRAVCFSVNPSPEIVGDAYLQSADNRRRYMRRGSRSPSMLAIHAVRSCQEIAQLEACDVQEEKLEQAHSLLKHVIRRSFSLPLKSNSIHPFQYPRSLPFLKQPQEATGVEELAQSLFHKTKLTNAEKRRLSLDILTQVQIETDDLNMHRMV